MDTADMVVDDVEPSFALADCKHRKKGYWAIDSLNPNVWSTGLRYLSSSSADVAFTQECKVPRHEVALAEQTARNAGWSTVMSDCYCTSDTGKSAGVAVSVRKHL